MSLVTFSCLILLLINSDLFNNSEDSCLHLLFLNLVEMTKFYSLINLLVYEPCEEKINYLITITLNVFFCKSELCQVLSTFFFHLWQELFDFLHKLIDELYE